MFVQDFWWRITFILQEGYNSAYCRTSNMIERVCGWFKRRFHVLHRVLLKVCGIIGAWAILLNSALSLKEEIEGGNPQQDTVASS